MLSVSQARVAGGREEPSDPGLPMVNHAESPLGKSIPFFAFYNFCKYLGIPEGIWLVLNGRLSYFVMVWSLCLEIEKALTGRIGITHSWELRIKIQLRYIHWVHCLFFLDKCISDDKKLTEEWLDYFFLKEKIHNVPSTVHYLHCLNVTQTVELMNCCICIFGAEFLQSREGFLMMLWEHLGVNCAWFKKKKKFNFFKLHVMLLWM